LENQISDKTKEIAEKTERLEISNKMIKSRDAEISELKRQLQKERERAEKTNKIILEKDLQNKNLTKENEELQSRLHLAENNLLALPNKKQSKFKLFKEKTKTKLQQFKQLIKEELVCKVEVRNK
jgi:predicted  nucleic acid-binding Zn-ribbon protein